mgnify:CR=1 FL=1
MTNNLALSVDTVLPHAKSMADEAAADIARGNDTAANRNVLAMFNYIEYLISPPKQEDLGSPPNVEEAPAGTEEAPQEDPKALLGFFGRNKTAE